MKLYEYIDTCLKSYGCKQAFGVPGSLIMPVWQNIPSLNLTLCSHEQEASYIASGYSKASGELTAVITTGSPGVTNCLTGIAGANMDSIALIYISGKNMQKTQDQGTRQEEGNHNRNFRSTDILSPVTKLSMEITDINFAAEQFRQCCELAISGRKGCVHICIPLNLQAMELPFLDTAVKGEYSENVYYEKPHCLRPLIILGWGCRLSGAAEMAYQLAEKINAPILVTVKAYSCIQKEHPLYVGKLGYGYNTALETFLEEYSADCVLVFGSSMSQKDISPSCKKILEKSDVCVYTLESGDVKIRFSNAEVYETGDLQGLLSTWLSKTPFAAPNYTLYRKIAESKEEQEHVFKNTLQENDALAHALYALNSFSEDVILTADAGNNLLNAAVLYTPKKMDAMFLNDGIRSMGSGICETVGMAMARPDRYYLAVVGDGGMLMNGNVMYMAARLNLPIAFLVINNTSLGRVRIGQKNWNRFIGTDLGHVDFMLYSKAFGLESYSTHNVLEWISFVKNAVSQRIPVLIELLSDKDEIPLKLKLEGAY